MLVAASLTLINVLITSYASNLQTVLVDMALCWVRRNQVLAIVYCFRFTYCWDQRELFPSAPAGPRHPHLKPTVTGLQAKTMQQSPFQWNLKQQGTNVSNAIKNLKQFSVVPHRSSKLFHWLPSLQYNYRNFLYHRTTISFKLPTYTRNNNAIVH